MWGDVDNDTEQHYEQDRQALARLLQQRDEQHAAAIVAVSSYRDVCVDNWDGGQYEAVLSIPPELYDHAREEFAAAIDKACACLIGEDRYRGLNIALRPTPVNPGWVTKVLEALSPRWVSAERVAVSALDSAEV